jgi:hypothetical protein
MKVPAAAPWLRQFLRSALLELTLQMKAAEACRSLFMELEA